MRFINVCFILQYFLIIVYSKLRCKSINLQRNIQTNHQFKIYLFFTFHINNSTLSIYQSILPKIYYAQNY